MLKRLFTVAQIPILLIVDFLFPLLCAGCGANGTALCMTCMARLPRAPYIAAPNTYALWNYKDPTVKKSLWKLKYRGRTVFAKEFGVALYDSLLEELAELALFYGKEKPLLIPIPISKKRFRKRGFNQTELIARHMSFIDKNESFTLVTNVLYKIKDTPSQMSIKDKRKRLHNLRDSFMVKNATLVRGKNVILLDDIITTGATLREAKRTLRSAGARKIICFALAH